MERGGGRRNGGTIGSVRAAATYELVADHIRRAIFLGRFLPGEMLPAERDLASQLSVSRTTLREAIRVLEGEGIIEIRRGATGGLMVLGQSGLDASEIAHDAAAQRTLIDNIFDYRIANECVAASLAAARRTPEHLVQLGQALAEMNAVCATPESRAEQANVGRFLASDSEFHLIIARACGNPFLLRAVEDARATMFLPIGKVFVCIEEFVNNHHAEIYRAIAQGDGDRAAAEMRLHIEETRQSVLDLLGLPAE